MHSWWIIIWLSLLGYVSYRAAHYYGKKRWGLGVAFTIVAIVIAFEVVMQFQPASPAPVPGSGVQGGAATQPAQTQPAQTRPSDAGP